MAENYIQEKDGDVLHTLVEVSTCYQKYILEVILIKGEKKLKLTSRSLKDVLIFTLLADS